MFPETEEQILGTTQVKGNVFIKRKTASVFIKCIYKERDRRGPE